MADFNWQKEFRKKMDIDFFYLNIYKLHFFLNFLLTENKITKETYNEMERSINHIEANTSNMFYKLEEKG